MAKQRSQRVFLSRHPRGQVLHTGFVWDLNWEINIKIAVFALYVVKGLPPILIYLPAISQRHTGGHTRRMETI